MVSFLKIFRNKKSTKTTNYISSRASAGELRNNKSEARINPTSSEYRRGRTMPGSTKWRLDSSDKRAVNSATPREKAHHLSKLRRSLLSAFGGLIVSAIALFILLEQFTATVHIQSKDRYEIANFNRYVDTTQMYFDKHPLERLRFNLNEERFNEFIISKHPEVESITQIGIDGFATSLYSIEMRKPVIGWDVGSKQYFVDSNGVSFEKNFYHDPTVKIVDNSGVEYAPGTAVVSERFLSFVGRVVSLAKERSLIVEKVTIPVGTTRQVKLGVKGYSYPVLVSIDRSAAEQVEDMERALQYFKSQGRTPKYIDLRVEGKAFYRE